jgi:hypothetical protein
MAIYQDRLLDSSSNGIRLLRLMRGKGSDDVECTVFRSSVEQAPEYTALSYVWGDPSITRPIILNGQTILITANLHVALCHLRPETSDVILWVDALCINQNDFQERSAQVSRMKQIFGAAKDVIAWVGEARGDGHLAIQLIENFTGTETDLQSMRNYSSNPTSEIWQALNWFWTRPYWERVWVIQELAAARLVWIQYGHLHVSLGAVHRVSQAIRDSVLYRSGDTYMAARRLLNLSQAAEQLQFASLLWNIAEFKVTDPRDRVYGILAVAKRDYRVNIVPDYSKSLHQVVQDLLLYHLDAERSLEILCYFPSIRQVSPSSCAPSWVLDITHRLAGLDPCTYQASAGRESMTTFTDPSTMVSKGILISVIKRCKGPFLHCSPKSTEHESGAPNISILEEMEHSAFVALGRRYPQKSAEFLENCFWNMITGNRGRSAREDRGSNCPLTSRQLWDSLIANEKGELRADDLEKKKEYLEHMFIRLPGRCFFTTAYGHIGLGPPNIQEDDLVCVLFGCPLCIILRERGDHQTFIGPAYVDGVMDGNCVRILQTRQENSLLERDFVIK